MSKIKKVETIDEQRAREIAVYGMTTIATLIRILEKSKLVGIDPVATDVHKYLLLHNQMIINMVDGKKTLEQVIRDAQPPKNS